MVFNIVDVYACSMFHCMFYFKVDVACIWRVNVRGLGQGVVCHDERGQRLTVGCTFCG